MRDDDAEVNVEGGEGAGLQLELAELEVALHGEDAHHGAGGIARQDGE